jgi:hypothetical protein
VRVNDGEIVFPDLLRPRAVAEGVWWSEGSLRDAYESHLRHIADNGARLRSQAVGDGPYRVLQVKRTGARRVTTKLRQRARRPTPPPFSWCVASGRVRQRGH